MTEPNFTTKRETVFKKLNEIKPGEHQYFVFVKVLEGKI